MVLKAKMVKDLIYLSQAKVPPSELKLKSMQKYKIDEDPMQIQNWALFILIQFSWF